MENFVRELLKTTRFTTNSINKNFVPRRIGLGYDLTYECVDREIIKECKKKKRKRENVKVEEESSSDNFSKTKSFSKK